MTAIAGGSGAAIASSFASNSNKIESVKPIKSPQNGPTGKIGNLLAGNFGDLSHLAKVQGGTTKAPALGSQPPQGGGAIGNLLAGNFGSLTAQRGLMTTPGVTTASKNKDQHDMKTHEQELDEAIKVSGLGNVA
jgi:hypothetical protein